MSPTSTVGMGRRARRAIAAGLTGACACAGFAVVDASPAHAISPCRNPDPRNVPSWCSKVPVAAVEGGLAAARCLEPRLRITLVQASPGASHHGYVLRFQNQGGACTLTGYPGVDALSAQGHRLVSAQRTMNGYLGGVPPGGPIPLVYLAHEKSASAVLEWVDGPVPGLTCPQAQSLKITPPNAFHSVLRSPSSLGSERLCDLEIHPVVAGLWGQGS
jgi:Protein of unknown function (DUF4232)